MQSSGTCQDLIHEFSAAFRVILLGRAASTIHGFQTPPGDYEIWMDPLGSSSEWTRQVLGMAQSHLRTQLCHPRTATVLDLHSATACIDKLGSISISGLDVALRVYRAANEFNVEEFDAVWSRSTPLSDGLRVPCLLDLFLNKINSGNPADYDDLLYLEQQVKAHLAQRLPFCDESEATRLLERYIDPDSLRHARRNPHSVVRRMAQEHLKKFADKGDPYSTEILDAWDSPLNPLD